MIAYLDHAATTPLRPEVAEAMQPWLHGRFGNPSGSHSVARAARQAVDEARDVVAAGLGCQPGEVVFTSGGTEADNLAVAGVVAYRRTLDRGGSPGQSLCSAIEHHAVLHSVEAVGGHTVAVDGDGVIDLDRLADGLNEEVAVVSVMLANNEVGTVEPLVDVAEVVRRRAPRAALHTDAVQAFSWLDVASVCRVADLVSVAAHKFGGPQGVGALVVRDGIKLEPMMRGGGQERERRSGTHNVAGIVGMAAAVRATVSGRVETARRVEDLRGRLARGVGGALAGVVETASGAPRLPNICHLRIDGIESESLLVLLDQAGLCASAGSACASGALEPSHVLSAMGVAPAEARSSLRLSLGWTSTVAEVDAAVSAVVACVERLRGVRGAASLVAGGG